MLYDEQKFGLNEKKKELFGTTHEYFGGNEKVDNEERSRAELIKRVTADIEQAANKSP